MLIQSHRHKPEDLRVWSEMESSDAEHSRSLSLHRKIGRAIASIQRFASGGQCYASISWGKDSTAMAGLVRQSGLPIPMIWVRVEPIANPDCAGVRDHFAPERYTEIEQWCRWDSRGWHAKGTLEAGFAKAATITGTDRCLLGIRQSESGSRRLSAMTHGVETDRRCRPLLHWSDADVFAYLYAMRLPVHPAYAMSGGGRWDRGRIRVSSLGGRRGDGMGRAEWEREYYGDVLRQIESGRPAPCP